MNKNYDSLLKYSSYYLQNYSHVHDQDRNSFAKEDLLSLYWYIAECYYYKKDYFLAISYYKAMDSIKRLITTGRKESSGNGPDLKYGYNIAVNLKIGFCYLILENSDSALKYFASVKGTGESIGLINCLQIYYNTNWSDSALAVITRLENQDTFRIKDMVGRLIDQLPMKTYSESALLYHFGKFQDVISILSGKMVLRYFPEMNYILGCSYYKCGYYDSAVITLGLGKLNMLEKFGGDAKKKPEYLMIAGTLRQMRKKKPIDTKINGEYFYGIGAQLNNNAVGNIFSYFDYSTKLRENNISDSSYFDKRMYLQVSLDFP